MNARRPCTYSYSSSAHVRPRVCVRCGKTSCGGVGWRLAMPPRRGLLELGGDTQKEILAAYCGDELDADGQVVGRPVQRQRDRRLAGDVPRHGERRDGAEALADAQRLF